MKMKRYFDLHLIHPKDDEELDRMKSLAVNMGFHGIAITSSNSPKINEQKNLKIYSRIDIEAKTTRDLLGSLLWARKNFDVVSVKCITKEVARQVAKDRRVDILLFPSDTFQRKTAWLDNQEAELAEVGGCAYEVNASDLLSNSSVRLSRFILKLKKELSNAERHRIPVIISSGAQKANEMREPKALTSLISLLDIDEEEATAMLTMNSAKLLASRIKNCSRRSS